MTLFQLIGVGVLGLFASATVVSLARHRLQMRAGLAWLGVWLAGAGAIADPALTVRLARAVGIGRGADLVFYCAILAMVFGAFVIHLRFRRLEREITLLVRHLAMLEAGHDQRGEGTAGDGSSAARTE